MNYLRTFFVLALMIGLVGCGETEVVTETDAATEAQPEVEVQQVGDIEVVVEKEPDIPDTNEDDILLPELNTEPVETDVEVDAQVTVETMTDEEIRDIDAEMDAFIEEILSGIE